MTSSLLRSCSINPLRDIFAAVNCVLPRPKQKPTLLQLETLKLYNDEFDGFEQLMIKLGMIVHRIHFHKPQNAGGVRIAGRLGFLGSAIQ